VDIQDIREEMNKSYRWESVTVYIPTKYGMCIVKGSLHLNAAWYWEVTMDNGVLLFPEWAVRDVLDGKIWLK